ncbi:arf-GAP domain and FG repeat-containing protein 2 isoform X1 [Lepisosteus oculatus]|uniref:arf-GAP domain and FG repeat-containing protein 2 isoform X1 n=2 Tax=Lepisosteus oculatus TaxID=7918 RepID=UPI00371B18EF
MAGRKHRDQQEICSGRVRELARSRGNKQCFECDQPGVTYVDITVGSFVCTSCSGMLRGLNPPHRVKSISMTTFSQQEVEFLQCHGNEVCKTVWLAIYEPRLEGVFDPRDTQKLKEFLQDKYEKKKWHISKSKRTSVDGPWSPAVPPLTSPQQSSSAPPVPNTRPTRTQSQTQPPSWERGPPVSPTGLRTEAYTTLPSRSQSFRESPKDLGFLLSGSDKLRSAHASPGMGPKSQAPAFPALPRPSGRSASSSSSSSTGPGPFRAFPRSSSVDFGGLTSPQQAASGSALPPRDKYAALSQLDGVFAENVPGAAPPNSMSQYSSLFSNKLSSSSTPGSSPGFPKPVSSPPVLPDFPSPFSTTPAAQPAFSASNPFSSNSAPTGDDSNRFSSSSSQVFPHSASFPPPKPQNAFLQQPARNQHANGEPSLPGPKTAPRPNVSINPFTGTVYPKGRSTRNPFI